MKKNLMLVGAALSLSSCTLLVPSRTDVTIIGVNDFHGNLLPTSFRVPDPTDRTKTVSVKAGGIEAIGGVLAQARKENPNTVFVGVGDMTGASPLISALLRDEPTIDALTALGMQVNVVGNHEFDNGLQELLRFQKGGCNSNAPERACKYENTFPGAGYTYIASNVIDEKTGQRVFPAYKIVKVGPARIAFVGAVLKETPTVVTPSGVAGLRFEDEVASINSVIPQIKQSGADAIIALVHQGGASPDAFDVVNCKTLTGPIVDIAKRLDSAISVIMTGHTHRGYNCMVPGPNGQDRVVIQGDAYGHLLQRLDLSIDTRTNRVLSVQAKNVVVDPAAVPADPAMTAIVQKAKTLTDPVAQQTVATLGVEQITRAPNPAGESALGDVIADSQLAATRSPEKGGAVIAFMNPGGIRADLPVNV
ncbi:MAG: metallophosphoesterase, partial [Deinococcota bacterium]